MADATTPAVDVATNGHQAHEAELSPQQNGTNKSVSLFPPRIITSSSTENVHHQTSSHPAPPPKGKSLNNSISAMSIPDVAEARRPVSSTRGAAVPPSPSDIAAAMHSKSYTSTPAHASTHANNHKTATTAGARTVVQRDNTTSSPRSNVSETLKKIAATSKNLKNPAAMRMALLDLKTVIQPESSSTRRTTTRRTFTNTATANPTNTRRANPSQSPTRAAAAAGTPSEDTASAGSGARRPALHVDCVPLRTTAAADHNGSPKSPSTMLRSTGNPTKHGSPARNSPAQRSFIPSRRMVDLTQEDARELSLSSAGFQRILTKRSRQPKKVLNVSHTKYAVVRRVAAVSGFSVQETEEEFLQYQFNMAWSDTVLPLTQLTRLQNWQRTNHFPAMYLICRKGHLSSTLGVMRKRLPEEFEFFPRTWSMRTERTTFSRVVQAINQRKLTRYFIMKPNSGCQGRGIIVTRDPMNALENADNYIVQEYVHRPLLLEGRKFDLRIYVLLMNIRQPSIFMFNDGLVRLCAESYEPPTDDNTKNSCKHLTNYAVNKRSPEFVFNTDAEHGDVGNKRNFRFLNGWLLAEGHNVDDFWESIGHIIVKTILAAQPQISSVYNSCFPSFNEGYSCFEVLGFDILVDDHMKPWLMEVNHTPSLATDTPLDNDIKSKLVEETWDIVDCKSTDLMKERDREREEFTKHNLPPWASNHPLYGTVKSRGADGAEVSSPTTTEDGATKPSFTLVTPGRHRDDLEQLEERRALEDTKLKNYARIYPPGDYATQEMFDRVLKVAQEECPAEFKGRASNALRRTATPRSMASSARSRPRPARTPPPAPSSPITASPTTAASSAAEVKANATRFNTNNHGAAYASILGSNVLHAKAPANNSNKTSASASATTTPAAAHPEHHKPVLAISTTTADSVATNPSSPITPGGTPTSFPTKNEKLEPTEEELQWLQQLQQQLDKAASEDPEPVSCSDFPE